MKKLFIPLKQNLKLEKGILEKLSKELPEKIFICYSIQYENLAKEIKGNLKNKKINGFSQVLGCSRPKVPENTQAILLISDGRFHAISLSYETKKQVYLLENNNLVKISTKNTENLEKKEKVALMKFLHEDQVGVIISTKPGQARLKESLNLKNKIKNKKLYFFLANEVNLKETENFGLKSWINSSCPRMNFDDNSLINLSKLPQ